MRNSQSLSPSLHSASFLWSLLNKSFYTRGQAIMISLTTVVQRSTETQVPHPILRTVRGHGSLETKRVQREISWDDKLDQEPDILCGKERLYRIPTIDLRHICRQAPLLAHTHSSKTMVGVEHCPKDHETVLIHCVIATKLAVSA